MKTRTVSTPLRPSHAVTADGELLPLSVFEERCRWLLDLTAQVFNATSPQWWTGEKVDALTSGQDAAGKDLPQSGFVAASRLGWTLVVPEGLYLPDRFKRGVLVRLMATFRGRRDEVPLMEAMRPLVDWAGEFVSAEVRATEAGQWATHVQLDRLARSLTRFRKVNGVDPEHLTDLFPAPQMAAPVFPLSACDRQFAVMTRSDAGDLTLRVKLPLTPFPRRTKDWGWHTVLLPIPAFRREVQDWCLPDLNLSAGKVLFRAASKLPEVATLDLPAAVGVDWSPSSLLCAGVVRKVNGHLVTDGQACGWDDGGKLSKLLRLQREEEYTRTKARHLARLLASRPDPVTQAQRAVLEVQQEALSRKRVRLGRALAWQGANHLVDLARRSGASLIAFEDLRDLDTQGRGVFQNNRSSQSVRGVLYACTEQAASRYGIEVVQVPARGTSAQCPGCNGLVKRPDGYHSAACEACGLTGNRDVVACVNIAKRALLGREQISRPRGRPARVKTVLHEAVQVRPEKPKLPRLGVERATRSRIIPPRRIRTDRAGRRIQNKHHQVFPARVSLRGQVERTSLNVIGNLTNTDCPTSLLEYVVLDGVLMEV